MKKIIAWENWSEIEKDLTDESIIIEDIQWKWKNYIKKNS